MQQSEERYNEMKRKQNPRYPLFDAEFHALDLSKVNIETTKTAVYLEHEPFSTEPIRLSSFMFYRKD